MNRIVLFLMLAGLSLPAVTQTLLYPGDIALVNVNTDGDKNFDVLFLKEVSAGTVVYFTDDAWINASQQFRGSEGIMVFTSASAIPAGTVVSCPGTNGGNGFGKHSGSFNPSGSGDNIIIYQGSAEDPFFLYGTGWARGSTVWEFSETSASYRSDIPPGLSVAESSIASLGTDDNYQYNAASPMSGTLDELLISIADPANWNKDNTLPFSAITQNFTITPSLLHFITITDPAEVPMRSSVEVSTAVSLSGSLTCQSLTISSGGVLEILPGAILRVFGEITNEEGNGGLIIRSGPAGSGSLIHSAPGVQGTVERWIGADQWHFVSSPVSDPGDINTLFGTTADYLHGIYYYNETGGEWVSAAGTTMDPGRGYNVCYTGEGRTVSFRGTLNDHRIRRWLQVTRGSGSGWNLVGNPFPCSLNWGAADQADACGWKNQSSVLENKTIYITTGGSGAGTTFDTYNGSSGIGVPDNSVGTISIEQAFWVHAAADGELGVGCYAKSVTQGTFKSMFAPRLKSGDSHTSQALMPIFRFTITSLATGQSDQLVVMFDDRAEPGLDRFDSQKLIGSGNIPQIYINEEGIPLVIEAVPPLDPTGYTQTDTLPLTLILPNPGDYEIRDESAITLSHFHFSTNIHGVSFSFILEDRLTGARQALTAEHPYAFSAGAGVLEGRFMLTYGRMDYVEEWKCDNVIEEKKWKILNNDEALEIVFFEIPKSKCYILLFDFIGNKIARIPVDVSSYRIFLPKPINPGIYLIQVQGLTGYPVLKFFCN